MSTSFKEYLSEQREYKIRLYEGVKTHTEEMVTGAPIFTEDESHHRVIEGNEPLIIKIIEE